jgi:hypothetical protein
MDALKKAIVLLSQYNRLLEREDEDLRSDVREITDLIMRYMIEAKVDQKQYPETMAAMLTIIKSSESRLSNMESRHKERVEAMQAMTEVFMDLAIDPSATLQ